MQMNETLITSSGVIKNRSKPRVGVVSLHSLNSWFIDDYLDQGIDLTWESFLDELRSEGIEEDSKEWYERTDCLEFDSRQVLFGDWIAGNRGYQIDKNGKNGFAGTYNSSTGIVCVEYSKLTKRCHNTSPCYVMADGSGPCGDLDTNGDSVIAYTLPLDFFGSDDLT